jgi:cytoskeletal protein CcmA (bactofilin family)
MADTSSNVQFKVENGLLVLGTANVAGPAAFNSNVDINGTYLSVTANLQSSLTPVNNTYALGNTTSRWALNAMTGDFAGGLSVTNTAALGNTTITGFANVSTSLNVTGAVTVNGALTVNNTSSVGNTTVTGFINVSSTANVGGAVNLRSTLDVNGAVTIPNTVAVGNTTITGFANIISSSATFNALTGVANTTDFITTAAVHGFSNGDVVRYVVSTGNTAITGLTNGSNYYVISANTTAFQLATTFGGANINLTAGNSEIGHTLTPQRIMMSTSGNIESPLGLANVGSLRVLGTATVNGAVTLASTLSATGAVTFSNTLSATGAVTFSNTLSATGAVTFSNTIAVTGNATFSNTIAVTGNATLANSLTIAGNTTLSGLANVVGTSATFNALTGVANTTDFITTTSAHGFSNGDIVRYIVSTGNTAVTGLTNATNYYVVSANSTAFQLATGYGGANINLTASVSEVGHTLTPQRISLLTSGNIESPIGLANVGSLRVLGTAVVNGAVTLASTLGVTGAATFSNTITVTGNTTLSNTLAVTGTTTLSNNLTVSGNVIIDTDLLFVDGLNNRIGFKNSSPSATDLITISGNTVLTGLSAAIRFLSSNATHNASITIAGNTTNTRTTFTTYEANATASDGGFIFQAANGTVTTSVLAFNQTELKYKTGNVAHAGNFGIYDVNGTRLGP